MHAGNHPRLVLVSFSYAIYRPFWYCLLHTWANLYLSYLFWRKGVHYLARGRLWTAPCCWSSEPRTYIFISHRHLVIWHHESTSGNHISRRRSGSADVFINTPKSTSTGFTWLCFFEVDFLNPVWVLSKNFLFDFAYSHSNKEDLWEEACGEGMPGRAEEQEKVIKLVFSS